MVLKLRWLVTREPWRTRLVAGKMTIVMLCYLCSATVLWAQQTGVHYWHQGVMPPGAIGSRQLQRGGPLPGFFQPVEIKAPAGAAIALASGDRFGPTQPGTCRAGMLIGSVYRLRVTNISTAEGAEGLEVFPSVEVIDRLYAPLGQECRFAIPVELTPEDLKLALGGKFVTRVIYVEDPRNAAPVRETAKSQQWFEVGVGQDPLAVANHLGRPVAILRLGGRLPDQGADAGFFFGSPPYVPCPVPAMPITKGARAKPAAPARAEPVAPGQVVPPDNPDKTPPPPVAIPGKPQP